MARPRFVGQSTPAQAPLAWQTHAVRCRAGDRMIALVAARSMGRGIMQVAAKGGLRVLVFDAKPEAPRRRWRTSPS